MTVDASEEQKQLIQIAAMLGIELLATGGAFTDDQVNDESVTTLFTRLGTEYTYFIGRDNYLNNVLVGDNGVVTNEAGNILTTG